MRNIKPHGAIPKEFVDEHEEHYMKKSGGETDY
jgi:hypothetical protein